MEKLAALCCLWANGLGTKENYMAELDRLFLEDPGDDFLLELEGFGNDCARAWERLGWLAGGSLNIDIFGKELFAALEKVYNENKFPLDEFGRRCFKMWCALPYKPYRSECIEPFHTLTYAADPLSYGDEGQSRNLFEAAFDFYKITQEQE